MIMALRKDGRLVRVVVDAPSGKVKAIQLSLGRRERLCETTRARYPRGLGPAPRQV